MENKYYVIRDREAGNYIDYCFTMDEARDLVKSFEEVDRREPNMYEPDFYEIYECTRDELRDIVKEVII